MDTIQITTANRVQEFEQSARDIQLEITRGTNIIDEQRQRLPIDRSRYKQLKYAHFGTKQLNRRAPELLELALKDAGDINTIQSRLRSLEIDIDNTRSTIRDRCRFIKENLAGNEQRETELGNKLQQIAMERLKNSTKEIDLKKAKEQLLKNKTILDVNFTEMGNRGFLKMQVTFAPFLMKPSDEHPEEIARAKHALIGTLGSFRDYIGPEWMNKNINSIPDDVLAILMPKMTATFLFNLTNWGCFETAVNEDTPCIRAYGNAYMPHPHHISEEDPCYGDFYGALTDALNQHDLELFTVIYFSFLSQYSPSDSAGRLFTHWALLQEGLLDECEVAAGWVNPAEDEDDEPEIEYDYFHRPLYSDSTIPVTFKERLDNEGNFKDPAAPSADSNTATASPAPVTPEPSLSDEESPEEFELRMAQEASSSDTTTAPALTAPALTATPTVENTEVTRHTINVIASPSDTECDGCLVAIDEGEAVSRYVDSENPTPNTILCEDCASDTFSCSQCAAQWPITLVCRDSSDSGADICTNCYDATNSEIRSNENTEAQPADEVETEENIIPQAPQPALIQSPEPPEHAIENRDL